MFDKYTNLPHEELFKIKCNASIATLMDTPEVINLFEEIRSNLLNSIPTTAQSATQDREGIYNLVRATELIKQALQAKANDYNGLLLSEENLDSLPVEPLNKGRKV